MGYNGPPGAVRARLASCSGCLSCLSLLLTSVLLALVLALVLAAGATALRDGLLEILQH